MQKSKQSVTVSIAVCVVVAVVLLGLVVTAPWLFQWYMSTVRGVSPEAAQELNGILLGCFYPCAAVAAGMLYALLRLLFHIRAGEVFTVANVRYLKAVSWGCFVIAAVTAVGAGFYVPFLFVTAAGGFTGVLLRVLKNVMQTAVELREENELTV